MSKVTFGLWIESVAKQSLDCYNRDPKNKKSWNNVFKVAFGLWIESVAKQRLQRISITATLKTKKVGIMYLYSLC